MKEVKLIGRPKGVGQVNKTSNLVGDVIRYHRIKLKLSLREVSEKVNVSLMFISNIEQGRAPLPMHMVTQLSELLGVPVKRLADSALQSTKLYQEYVQVTEAA